MKRTLFIASLLLVSATFSVHAASYNRGDAQRALQQAGYQNIHELEHENGLWEANVVRKDGSHGEVALDPATGEIFDARNPRTLLSTQEVIAKLETLGYSNISSTDRDGATWEVEAHDHKGQRVELRVGGYDGRVLHSERDYDFD